MPKAYLIDVETRTVIETRYESLEDLQTLIGGNIELAYQWPNGDDLFVHEEGLLKDPVNFFHIPARPDQPLAGNGVVVGREVEGEQYPGGYITLDPTTTLDALVKQVGFAVLRVTALRA